MAHVNSGRSEEVLRPCSCHGYTRTHAVWTDVTHWFEITFLIIVASSPFLNHLQTNWLHM